MKIAEELGYRSSNIRKEEQYETDATWRLWNLRTPVIVPYYALMSPEKQKLYGVAYSEGLTKYGRELFNKQPKFTMMAPINHVKLYLEGIPIAYPNREATVGIYEDIYQHMDLWNQVTNQTLNRRSNAPPLEEFEALMEYADRLKIYVDQYDRMNGDVSALTPIQRATGVSGFVVENAKGLAALHYLQNLGIQRTSRNDNMRHITGYDAKSQVQRHTTPATNNTSMRHYGGALDDDMPSDLELER